VQLTRQQYRVLNACADDWELFFYLASEVSQVAQVGAQGAEPAGRGVSPDELVLDLVSLMQADLLECRRVTKGGNREPVGSVGPEEFTVYRGYACLSFDDHVAHFGYGPHEFRVTARGVEEIKRESYRAYDRELGWPQQEPSS